MAAVGIREQPGQGRGLDMVTDTIPALESETALDEAPPLSMTMPAAEKLQGLLV